MVQELYLTGIAKAVPPLRTAGVCVPSIQAQERKVVAGHAAALDDVVKLRLRAGLYPQGVDAFSAQAAKTSPCFSKHRIDRV